MDFDIKNSIQDFGLNVATGLKCYSLIKDMLRITADNNELSNFMDCIGSMRI